MKVTRTGAWDRLSGLEDREATFRVLRKAFSYRVEGAEFAPAFRGHVWDGRVSLVQRIRGEGVVFPAGLTPEVLALLRMGGATPEVVDERPEGEPWGAGVSWQGYVPREYQWAAIRAAARSESGGLIRVPIRGGKTLIAAAIAAFHRTKTLFVVTSDLLRRQAIASFRRDLRGATVTAIGDSEWDDSGDVVVATIQSLARHRQERRFHKLSRACGVVFCDEVHHLPNGEEWRACALALRGRRKYGLSATVEIDHDTQNQTGAIWLRGICGPTLYAIELDELIQLGFVLAPTVTFLRHGAPRVGGKGWSPNAYTEHVVSCPERNEALAAATVERAQAGRRVLVDVQRVGHARLLASMISRRLPPGTVQVLTGTTKDEVRERTLAGFRSGEVLVIVGTILGEGVDLPELEVVVNAEGGLGFETTVQRLRCLTFHEGKQPEVIECADTHHDVLAKWTRERLKIYRGFKEFRVNV